MYSRIQSRVSLNLFSSFLTIGAGFALNRAKLFNTEATRGGSQIILVRRSNMYLSCTAELTVFDWQNVALPCLLFSHIVPAIGTHNISSLAPLVVVGVIYGAAGMFMAWIIKSFFWVPHRFRYGILAAGCWGNGDLRMCTLPLADRAV